MPTLREEPGEAEIASHKLLLRAGMIRRSASGVYSYLPLGYRAVRKIENLVREGMDRYGAQEILMSAIQPKEIWEASGRWGDYGPEMFKVKDRHNREFCLGPTAEEYFTTLIKGEIRSYKQLPLNIYQIQTKYRDEKRPRFGINRAREFLMKDAYTFDVDHDAMVEAYMNMWRSYEWIFDQLRLNYRIVRGDSGAMGGNQSHEFIALSDIGEGVIVYCDHCDYAATDEKAAVVLDGIVEEEKVLEKVHTPGTKTIEAVADFLNLPEKRCAKALLYMVAEEPVLVMIPGDRELNEVKLSAFLQAPDHDIRPMEEEEIERYLHASGGFIGPVGVDKDLRVVIDSHLTKVNNLVVGANEVDHHLVNVNYGRDFDGEIAEDLLVVKEGDKCPQCGETLEFARGIEVGNIFQLGTKYSTALDAKYLDENGKEQYFWMGSYGVGVTRSVTAVIEQNYDEKGIIWPTVVAPYHAIVTVVNTRDEEANALGEKIYNTLQAAGVEVMLDDRKDRAGVKFNDRDLIGIPYRITVGKKAAESVVEYSTRREMVNEELTADEAIERVSTLVREDLQYV